MKDIVEKIKKVINLQRDYGDWNDEKFFAFVDKLEEIIDVYEKEQANKTFLDRLKEEREELKERLEKLNIFLHKLYVDGTVFVTDTQAHYLKEQREYMQGYLDILDKRLKDLEEGNIVTIGKE